MKRRLSPLQAAVVWGIPGGLLVGLLAMLSGVYRIDGAFAALLDALVAFAVGAGLFGAVAAFVQWRRIVSSMGDVAPPGWYDSPDEDGTQWFWTGTRWSGMSRPTPPKMQIRRF